MKQGDFLKEMATKVGKQNDTVYSELFSSDTELPDEFCNDLLTGLLSLESAKSNPKVKAHFTAQALNGIDVETKSIIDELGLQIEFDEKDNSYSKIRKVKAAFQDLLNKKPEKTTELETLKNELHKKNGELLKQLDELKVLSEKEKREIKEAANAQVLNFIKGSELKGRKWANNTLADEVNSELAGILVTRELAKVGAKETNINGRVELRLLNDETLPYQDEKGNQVSYGDFVTKVLADNKLVVVTDPQIPQQPNNVIRQNFMPTQVPANANPKDIAMANAVNATLQSLKAS